MSRKLVLMGGGGLGSASDAIFGKVIELAGGKGKARLGIITAGSIPESKDPRAGTSEAYNSKANGAWYVKELKKYGAADATWLPIDLDHVSNNASAKVVAQVKQMNGFVLGSGDQSRLVACLLLAGHKDSPVMAAIRQRFQAGAVVAGTSAGTAFLSPPPMVTGGESYEALRHGALTKPDPAAPRKLTYDAAGGAGFFTHGPLDTHCSERGRQGRLLRLASDRKKTRAYCIDEATALVVSGLPGVVQMEVLGLGGVWILDLAFAKAGTASGHWSLAGARATYLSRGDLYMPETGKVLTPTWKTSLAGREWYVSPLSPSTDIFSSPKNLASGKRKNPRELVRMATRLVDHQSAYTTHGKTYETGPAFKVTLTRGLATTAFQGKLDSVNYYAFHWLRLDIAADK